MNLKTLAEEKRIRYPLMLLGMLSLLAGLWAGLYRLGWTLWLLSAETATMHGPLMVCGFLGTLIGLERAAALGRLWAFSAPVLTGLGRSF